MSPAAATVIHRQSSADDAVKTTLNRCSSAERIMEIRRPTRPVGDKDDHGSENAEQNDVCCICKRQLDSSRSTSRSTCHHRCCAKCVSKSPCLTCQSETSHLRDGVKQQHEEPTPSQNNADVTLKRHRRRTPSKNRRSPSYSPCRENDVRSSDRVTATTEDPELSQLSRSSSFQRSRSFNHDRSSRSENAEPPYYCNICNNRITNPKTLPCEHTFCTKCIDEALRHAPKCPRCKRNVEMARDYQPNGATMEVRRMMESDLHGFARDGTIEVHYHIPFQNVRIFINV